jgi:flagellar basal body-associated protein FliL
MAKKKQDDSLNGTGAEGGEGAEGGDESKPKSKKKLIIMVAVFVLIGGMVAKTVLLKPKPLTAAQVAAAAELADVTLANTCASHNGLPTKPLPTDAAAKDKGKDKAGTTTTTIAPDDTPAGPVDSLDAITINLAAGHYVKVGLALQVPAGVVPKDVAATENWEALALKTAIDTLSGQTLEDLTAHRQDEEHSIGDAVCRQTEGKVLTVYFTDFVMQ